MSDGYVCNTGDGTVTKFDLTTFAVVGSPLSVGTEPYKIVIDHAGLFAYVTDPIGGDVFQIDLSTFTISDNVAVPKASSLAIDPIDAFLYVAAAIGPSLYVYKIDLSTFTVAATPLIILGAAIGGIAVDPTNTFIYLTSWNGGSNTDTVKIDVATFSVTSTLSTNTDVSEIVIDSVGNYAYIFDQTLVQIDLATFAVSNTLTGSGLFGGFDIAPDDSYLICSIAFDLNVVNIPALTYGAPIVGVSDDLQVAIDSIGAYCYASDPSGNAVIQVDISSGSVIATLPVGTTPLGIAVLGHYEITSQQIFIL